MTHNRIVEIRFALSLAASLAILVGAMTVSWRTGVSTNHAMHEMVHSQFYLSELQKAAQERGIRVP